MSEKVDHIVWHCCDDGLPKESGRYLVSRFGYTYDRSISGTRLSIHKDFRFIDIALFLIDTQTFDNNENENIYAWAEQPEPM